LGYAAYWKILEICADKWDGQTDPVFTLNKKLIQNKLRTKSKQTSLVMVSLSLSNLCKVTENDYDYVIELPNLLKIKDNHTKNLPVTCQQLASNLPLDKTRLDKKRRDKNIIGSANKLDKQVLVDSIPKQNTPSVNSPLEVLSFTDPEVITWIRKGTFALQEKLLKKYDYDYLSEVIQKAFYWQLENKKRQAGTFLSSWIDRDNNKKLKGNLSEADFNLKAFFEEAAAKIVPYDYSIN
jgi:hypothetical protein